MKLTNKEKFDAKIIKDYFSANYSNVQYYKGEDPPDIYLKYNSNEVGIELTELSPNLYRERVTIDKSYAGFIKNIGIKIPDHTHYLVAFRHANIKLNKKRKKKIKGFIVKFSTESNTEESIESIKCINGIWVKIKPIPSNKKSGTISQMSLNMDSCSRDINTVSASLVDANIEYVFKSIISKTIETKKEKCKNIKKPIWLAMHDSYFSYIFSDNQNESINLYKKIMKNIDFGIFDKIIITFKDKGITVFDRETT